MPFAGAVLQDDLAAAGAGHREEKHASVDGVVAGCDGTGKQERGVDRQVFEVDLGVVHLVVVEEPRGDEVLEYEIETHGAIALADPQLTDEQRVQRRQAELGQAVLELGQRVLHRVAQAREKLGVGSGAALDVGGQFGRRDDPDQDGGREERHDGGPGRPQDAAVCARCHGDGNRLKAMRRVQNSRAGAWPGT